MARLNKSVNLKNSDPLDHVCRERLLHIRSDDHGSYIGNSRDSCMVKTSLEARLFTIYMMRSIHMDVNVEYVS